MRILTVSLATLALSMTLALLGPVAHAQEPPPGRDPYGGAPPAPLAAAPIAPAADPSLAQVVRPLPPPALVAQWRSARVMNGFATAIGLLSAGLSISSAVYVAATHYPPSPNDFVAAPRPSDPGQVMSFVASGSSAFAFALAAGGLAWRHRILRKLDADPGRGLFAGGTAVGLIGLVAVASSYFVGFTHYVDPHDQSIVVLSTTLGGAALCNIATALYAKDSSNLTKAWKRLTTF
jgi:hypothetical protein